MNLQSLVSQTVGNSVTKATKPASKMAKVKPASKVAKVKAPKPAKVALSPYTVFFKASRNKWMAVNGQGRTEAARKTPEAALAFLKNKYDIIGQMV